MGRGSKAGLIAAGWLAGVLPVLADDLPEKLAEKLAPCLACHGVEGQSVLENVPSLGAQTAPYALIQLFMFREKMRVAEPMTEAAQGLSDGDLQAMSDALAAQPPPKPPDDPGDPTRLERARAVTEQHRCNFCHRPDYSGQLKPDAGATAAPISRADPSAMGLRNGSYHGETKGDAARCDGAQRLVDQLEEPRHPLASDPGTTVDNSYAQVRIPGAQTNCE